MKFSNKLRVLQASLKSDARAAALIADAADLIDAMEHSIRENVDAPVPTISLCRALTKLEGLASK